MHRLTAERPLPLTEGGARTGHESTFTEDLGVSHSSPETALRHVPASTVRHSRRWKRRRTVTDLACEAVCWAFFTACVVMVIGLACAMLWAVAP